jgi:Na+-driven multidrug efflux pump
MRFLQGSEASADADRAIDMGFNYLLVVIPGSVVTCIYYLLCGCLEAEGRTVWYGVIQMGSTLLNQVVFNPIAIIVFKAGIVGVAVAMIGAQLIAAIVLVVCFYRGDFTVKLCVKELFARPIKESGHALALGLTSLLSSLSSSLPIILFQRLLADLARQDAQDWIALYNDFSRLYAVAIALYLSPCTGLMAAGSYAYSATNISRLVRLCFHAAWILGVLGMAIAFTMDFAPGWVASWFSLTGPMIGDWKETVAKYWSSTTLMAWTYLGTTLLQITNRPRVGLASAIVGQVFVFPLASILWYELSSSPAMMFWAGLTNDVTAWVLTVAFDISTLIELWKRRREGPKAFDTIPHPYTAADSPPG